MGKLHRNDETGNRHYANEIRKRSEGFRPSDPFQPFRQRAYLTVFTNEPAFSSDPGCTPFNTSRYSNLILSVGWLR